MLLSFFFGLVGCNDSAFRQERFSRSQNRVAQDVHVMSTRHVDISKHVDQEIGEQRVQIVHTESGCLTAPSATSFVRTRLDQNVRMSYHVRTCHTMSDLILMRKNRDLKMWAKMRKNVSPWTEKIWEIPKVGCKSSKSSKRPWPPRRPAPEPGSSRCPHVVLTLSRCLGAQSCLTLLRLSRTFHNFFHNFP